MEINKELVRKMSELSRVKLSDAEVARLELEFREIFEYFASIEKIGSKGEQLFYVTGTKGEPRSDVAKPKTKEDADGIIANFVQKDGRILLAPKSMD